MQVTDQVAPLVLARWVPEDGLTVDVFLSHEAVVDLIQLVALRVAEGHAAHLTLMETAGAGSVRAVWVALPVIVNVTVPAALAQRRPPRVAAGLVTFLVNQVLRHL